MALILETTRLDGSTSRMALQPAVNRIRVDTSSTYRIFDDQTGLPVDRISVRRSDSDLVIDGLGTTAVGETVAVEFPEYYNLCSGATTCLVRIDTGGGAPVEISAVTQPIGALADGSFVLYDQGYVPSTLAGAGDESSIRPILYGLGGLAVAAGVAGAGGGGGGSTAVSSNGGEPAPDATLKVTSAAFVNSHTPVITGEGAPGARIVVQIDTNGDGNADVGYSTIVGGDFRWSVDLARDTPIQGALPPDGLSDSAAVRISQGLPGGTFENLPLYTLTYDDTPPARAVINPVADDNIVTGPEKNAGVVVSGTAEPDGTVLVTWGQASRLASVDANGNWQAAFSRSEIPDDGQTTVTAVARDIAGNSAVAAQSASPSTRDPSRCPSAWSQPTTGSMRPRPHRCWSVVSPKSAPRSMWSGRAWSNLP